MIKKRMFSILLIILLLVLFILYPVLAGNILPQKGTPMGDLSTVDNYKGTSRLLLKMFVGCLRLEEDTYVGGIPDYVQMLYLDALDKDLEYAKDSPVLDNTWYNEDGMYLVPKLEIEWKKPPTSYLYEGDCKLFLNYQHEYWNDGEQLTTDDDEPFWSLKNGEVYQSPDSTFTDGDDITNWGKELDIVTQNIEISQLTPEYGLNYEPWSTSYFVDNSDFKYSVSWEGANGNEITCENFGGKYDKITNAPNCCGDDYLWIMNGVYNFDGTSEDKSIDQLCLYGYVDSETGEPLVEAKESQPYHSSAKVGNHPYRKSIYCTPLAAVPETSDIHYSYDINNYDPLSTTEQRKLFFYDKNNPSNTVTDVGLWKTDTSANYCTHYFNDNGDNFEWLTPEQAGEINYFKVDNSKAYTSTNVPQISTVDGKEQFELNPKAPDYIYDVMTKQLSGDNYTNSDDFTICNLFLGGTWTGHHCCGNKYDVNGKKILENFNDEGTASNIDTEKGEHYVLAKNRLAAYALSAETSIGDVWKEPNKACYQGEAIESGEIRNEEIISLGKVLVGKGYSTDNKKICIKIDEEGNSVGEDNYFEELDDGTLNAVKCCKTIYPTFKGVPTYLSNSKYPQSFLLYDCQPSNSILNVKGTLNLCTDETLKTDTTYLNTLGKTYNFDSFNVDNANLFSPNSNIKTTCNSIYFNKDNKEVTGNNDRFAYCFTNNTWLSFDISDVPYEKGTNNEFDILGRYPKEDDVLHESSINPDFENIKNIVVKSDTGCCFEGDCWGGDKCFANGETRVDKYVDPNKVYLCANGEWTSGEPTYNWYHEDFGGEVDPDLTGLQYCVDKWGCACPEKDAYDLGDEDQHEIDICETYTKPESLCTREPAMFIGDRFCESTYEEDKDENGIGTDYNFKNPSTITSSQWTSRTKYLATSLLHLAQSKNSADFVLQCDTPKNVLNFYDLNFAKDLFVTEQDYNNFCVLKLKTDKDDEEIYLGTTLNPQLNYDEVPEQLYKSQTISEFEQCQDDDSCIEGYGCYKSVGANTGQCVKICYDGNDCEEEEECFTAEEVPEGELSIGLCTPTSVKDVDMFNIENLDELFYGTSDTTGLLDNDFLFDLASKTFTEAECKTILEGTNPQNGNGDDYLLFKSCDNDKVTFNNFTKAFIFSNNSLKDNDDDLTINYDEVTSSSNDFAIYLSELKDYYNQNEDKIAEKKEMSIINEISDFDKIYFARKKDNGIDKVIFGVLERKSDPDASGDPSSKLRYFAIIMYKNIFTDDKVCTELENSSPLLYCGYDDTNKIVTIIIPSTPNYEGADGAVMNYWSDLTAKIRLK